MPVKKWLIQYVIAVLVASGLLGLIQFLKGRGLEYSVEFGVLWGFISATLFLTTRIYYFKKGLYCKVCADLLPPEKPRNGNTWQSN
jgi:hypothetical protein